MDAIGFLEKIVSIDSVFPNEARLAHLLADELKQAHFDVEMQEFSKGRYNVLATRGIQNGKKPILLYGHMDTVPAYGYGQTGRDPFKLEEKDGRLYGLGAYDMKAGVAAIVQAVQQIHDGCPLKVMFVSDEEANSQGCYEAVKNGFLKDVEFAMCTEISDVKNVNDKTRTIMLGRRGRVQYEIEVPGKSAHAARPEQGISAVTEAATVAIELEKMNAELPKHPKLGQGNQFVRSFHSESVSLSLPDSAKMLVDRHLVLPENAESARKEIECRINLLYEKGVAREVRIEGGNSKLNARRAIIKIKPREVPYLMPYITPENNSQVKRLANAIKNKLGVQAQYNYGRSVADENLIAMQGVPVASFGPIGGGEHSSGEWVSKKSYLELIEVLTGFILGS